jgi:hypothetical protein
MSAQKKWETVGTDTEYGKGYSDGFDVAEELTEKKAVAWLEACGFHDLARRAESELHKFEEPKAPETPKQDCHSCGYYGITMYMEPYCFAFPHGKTLSRGAPKECLVDGVYTLWTKDTRRSK